MIINLDGKKEYFANFDMLGFKKTNVPVKDARIKVKHLYECPYHDCGDFFYSEKQKSHYLDPRAYLYNTAYRIDELELEFELINKTEKGDTIILDYRVCQIRQINLFGNPNNDYYINDKTIGYNIEDGVCHPNSYTHIIDFFKKRTKK